MTPPRVAQNDTVIDIIVGTRRFVPTLSKGGPKTSMHLIPSKLALVAPVVRPWLILQSKCGRLLGFVESLQILADVEIDRCSGVAPARHVAVNILEVVERDLAMVVARRVHVATPVREHSELIDMLHSQVFHAGGDEEVLAPAMPFQVLLAAIPSIEVSLNGPCREDLQGSEECAPTFVTVQVT